MKRLIEKRLGEFTVCLAGISRGKKPYFTVVTSLLLGNSDSHPATAELSHKAVVKRVPRNGVKGYFFH